MLYIKKYSENYKNFLDEFYIYFENTWKPQFDDNSLILNETSVKFRTNNSLENFNKRLKNYFNYKTPIYMGLFVDILIEEVIEHENYIIDENKKPLKLIPS